MTSSAHPPARTRRRGLSMVYGVMTIGMLFGVVSLAVDWGRVQLTRSQLQGAADGAALYAAAALPQGVNKVQKRAQDAIADNKINGAALTFDKDNDVEFGVWDQGTRNFVVLSGSARTTATAIRVSTHADTARGNALPLMFAQFIGKSSIDLSSSAIVTRGKPMSYSVPANACPWLAGMPTGSTVPGYDGNTTASTAPNNSPPQVTGIDLTPGTSLVFRQASGKTSYTGSADYGPDGQTDRIVAEKAVNGINTTKAPLNCLVGIFLDDRQPNSYPMAPIGDFSTPGSRNFDSLTPPIKQVFFIGDGLTDSGKLQEFIVPPGATRLYIGIMDEKGWWWDNEGALSTTFMDDHLTLVK